MGRYRKERLYVMVTAEEKNTIREKMKMLGMNNLSKFVRKALSVSPLVRINIDSLDKLGYEINRIGNNINQIAKIANQTKSIYHNDIVDMQTKIDTIDTIVTDLKNLFTKLNRGEC